MSPLLAFEIPETKISGQLRLAEIRNDALSLTIGPSTVAVAAMVLRVKSPLYAFRFPSFTDTSSTEESRPPYSEDIPPLYNDTFFSAELLKTDKSPKAWFKL